MNHHPILFSTDMVKAILEGRKSQTRRIIDPQPLIYGNSIAYGKHISTASKYLSDQEHLQTFLDDKCRYGIPEDILWVKETHYKFGIWADDFGENTKAGKPRQKFLPLTSEVRYFDSVPGHLNQKRVQEPGWYKRPSIFMEKKDARIFLEVKDVAVVKLQGITEEDAIAEGVQPEEGLWKDYSAEGVTGFDSPISSFCSLWRKINGLDSWEQNPWLWKISFKQTNKPENFIP